MMQGEMKYMNGDFYVGKFAFNKRAGRGRMVFARREGEGRSAVYVGEWKADKQSGRGIMVRGAHTPENIAKTLNASKMRETKATRMYKHEHPQQQQRNV
jgi:hypothetical protein